MLPPLASKAEAGAKQRQYDQVIERIAALIEGETDGIAILATVCCELHAAFTYFHWTGFYRVTAPELLKVGPYQGGHGCLAIPFHRGVCGKAARLKQTQRIDDVTQIDCHIACSSTTRSEIVVPLVSLRGELIGVLDVDSNDLAAFDEIDQTSLERIARMVGAIYPACIS